MQSTLTGQLQHHSTKVPFQIGTCCTVGHSSKQGNFEEQLNSLQQQNWMRMKLFPIIIVTSEKSQMDQPKQFQTETYASQGFTVKTIAHERLQQLYIPQSWASSHLFCFMYWWFTGSPQTFMSAKITIMRSQKQDMWSGLEQVCSPYQGNVCTRWMPGITYRIKSALWWVLKQVLLQLHW